MLTLNGIKRKLAENRLPCPIFLLDEIEERDERIKELEEENAKLKEARP